MLFGLIGALSWGAGEEPDSQNPSAVTDGAPFRRFSTYRRQPFARLALDDPELAACLLLSPGWWAEAAEPSASPSATAVARALEVQLAGVFEENALRTLAVEVAATREAAPAAAAFGSTLLLLLPERKPATVEEVSRVAAAALFRAAVTPAPVDPRCSEPLLALAEALSVAGSYSLLTLPPTLRPVTDWAQEKDTTSAIAEYAEAVLDVESSWATRRALCQRSTQWRGVPPALGQAAAVLLEAFSDADRARATPFDLLLGWRDDAERRFPRMPGVLRKALARPLQAGVPSDEDAAAEREAISASALERALESGSPLPTGEASHLTGAERLLAAAISRGAGLPETCAWVEAGPLPAALRTGCRGEVKESGFVFSRPRPSGGSDVVAATLAGEQGVLLRWPTWVLHPQVDDASGELLFVDHEGIWTVPLDGSAPPRVLERGSFRFLALSPGGGAFAAAAWPEGRVHVIQGATNREIQASGVGGLAWVAPDVLLASDGEHLVLAATNGDVRPFPVELPCTQGLAAGLGGAVALQGPPCDPGIARVSLGDGLVSIILELAQEATGVTVLADGSLLYADPDGLWRWRPGEQPARIGLGLTPGPG